MPQTSSEVLDDIIESKFSFLQSRNNDTYFVGKLRDCIDKFLSILMGRTFY